MLVYVHGNGQAQQLAELIREAHPEWDVRTRPTFMLPTSDELTWYKQSVLDADWVITQWIGSRHLGIFELSFEWIKKSRVNRGNVITVPSISFRAQMPHAFHLSKAFFAALPKSVLPPYHNVLIPYMILQNISDDQIIDRLLSVDLYPPGSVTAMANKDLTELRKSETFFRSSYSIGKTVMVSDIIEANYRSQLIGWTFDHPTRAIMAQVANRALELMAATPRIATDGNEFFAHTRCGILPSIASQLRLPADQVDSHFVHAHHRLDVPQLVRRLSADYRSVSLEQLCAMLYERPEIVEYFEVFEGLSELFNNAEAAYKAGDMAEATCYATELMTQFPTRPHGYQIAAQVKAVAKEFDTAELILSDGLDRCLAKPPLLALRAVMAVNRNDWPEAVRRWRALLEFEPNHTRGIVGLADALVSTGDFATADTILSEARRSQPGNFHFETAWAHAASRRGDWALALLRWSEVRETFPDNEDVRGHFYSVQERLALENAVESAENGEVDTTPPGRAQFDTMANPELRELVFGFESIGSNCEFGLVQRRFEAEPLGLLRWAWTPYTSLIHLLATRFDSMETPQHLTLRTDQSTKEWNIYDERSHVSFHTFIRAETSNADTFILKQSRRLRWLREKLIGDLEMGEKVFIYFTRNHSIVEDQIYQLHRLLLEYGPVTLVWVSVAERGEIPGSIEILSDGLLHGFIGRDGRVGDRWDILFDDWIEVCKNARQYLQHKKPLSAGLSVGPDSAGGVARL